MFPAQWFRYGFEYRRDEINTPEGQPETDQTYIYAVSERSARRKYKRMFGVEAGKLLSRNNW